MDTKRDVTLIAETGAERPTGHMRITMEMKGLVDGPEGEKEKAAQEALERVLTIAYGWYAYILGSAVCGDQAYVVALLESLKQCAWLSDKVCELAQQAKGEEEKTK